MQTLRAGTAQIEYASLLRRTLAAVIHSGREKEKEKDRCISIFEGLDQKRERLTSAERRLAELLTVRIEDFEPKAYALKPARPVEVLRELMDANRLKQRDLLEIFGTPRIVSEARNTRLHGRTHP